MTVKLRIKLARYQPAQSEIHLRQELRTYTKDKRVLIGYPNGQDGLILPAHECPFCSRAGKKKIALSRRLTNLSGSHHQSQVTLIVISVLVVETSVTITVSIPS